MRAVRDRRRTDGGFSGPLAGKISGTSAAPSSFRWENMSSSARDIVEEGLLFMETESTQGLQVRGVQTSHPRHTALGVQVQQTAQAPGAVGGQDALAMAQAQHTTNKHAGRAYLDADAVTQIYLAKHASAEARTSKSDLSVRLAHQYGVTAKTVRDIWKRRTWKTVTEPYWNVQQQQQHQQQLQQQHTQYGAQSAVHASPMGNAPYGALSSVHAPPMGAAWWL